MAEIWSSKKLISVGPTHTLTLLLVDQGSWDFFRQMPTILPYIALSSKRARRRLLLQILLQNPLMNGQNGCLYIAWLGRALAEERLRSLIFMMPACARPRPSG